MHQMSETLWWGCRWMSISVQSNILRVGRGELFFDISGQPFMFRVETKEKSNKSRWKALCSDAALRLWGLCSGCLKCTRCWDYADTGDFDPRECCLRFTVLCSRFSNRTVSIHSWYIFCLGLVGLESWSLVLLSICSYYQIFALLVIFYSFEIVARPVLFCLCKLTINY